MSVSAGREFLSIPGPTVIPDAVLAAMQRPAVDIYSGPLVALTDSAARRHEHASSRTAGPLLHLRGERPRRLGSRAHQCALARRQGAGAGKRPLRDRLGRGREDARRRGRGAAGRHPPRGAARGGRGAAEGGPRRASRPILVAQIDTASGVRQRHQGDRRGDARGGPRRAADGRCGRLARLHAVRDGRLGRRRRDGGLAEGPDDAAGL